MASYGLLGAIAGAGQALQTIGANMEKRRQDALEWARAEAKAQRERAQKLADKADDRSYGEGRDQVKEGWQRERMGMSHKYASERQDDQQAHAVEQQGRSFTQQRSLAEYNQGRQDKRQVNSINARRDMLLLGDKLTRSRNAESQMRAEQLRDGDPQGIIWKDGPGGTQQAVQWWNDGRTKPLDIFVTKKSKGGRDSEEDLLK